MTANRRSVPGLALALSVLGAPSRAQDLYFVQGDTNDLYRLSARDASIAFVQDVGVNELSCFKLAPDGAYYGIDQGASVALYRFDPPSLAPTQVGPLNLGSAYFEGGMAFAPDGTLYATNWRDSDTSTSLLRVDTATGQAAIVGSMGQFRDVNGLGWRTDGMLVGLDAHAGQLVAIDPQTGGSTVIAPTTPNTGANATAGLTIIGTVGYYVSGSGGVKSLWRFDPFTGADALVGPFSPPLAGFMIKGLTLAAESDIGDSYCDSTPSSTQFAAYIGATGSAAIADGAFMLTAAPVPSGAGVFFYGLSTGQAPFGDGYLCLDQAASPLARLPALQSSGSVLAHHVDFQAAPTAATTITAGSTWSFQAWFADPAAGGSGFNLSNAVQVTFH